MTTKERILPDTVYYTTNLTTLIEVVEKTDEIKKSDLLKEDFIKLLGIYTAKRIGIVLVSFNEDNKLNGCMVISKHQDKRGQYLYIDFGYFDPHYPELREKFFTEIEGTCRVRGIKRVQVRTNRNFKAIQRLYGKYKGREISKIIEWDVL
jgi:hypothetical protein